MGEGKEVGQLDSFLEKYGSYLVLGGVMLAAAYVYFKGTGQLQPWLDKFKGITPPGDVAVTP